MTKLTRILILMLMICASSLISTTFAGERFTSSYSCSDAVKKCESSGIRKVDGFEVHKDCWEYSYTKTCSYPSKDNCKLYAHCYLIGDIQCLLQDSLQNCVNMEKEFSCKRWEPRNKEDQTVRMGFEAKDGQEGLICKGVPCIDGNCVDKSYMTNGEMMDSLSKLYATSNMKPDGQQNFKLFEGFGSHCSKKVASYSNCCQLRPKGWGRQLGAGCSKDEQDLADRRLKNLCVYVGQSKSKKLGVTMVTKEHFCCFGNMLEKVVQVEGRKQLGMNFGGGGSPNCRGLTLEEIQKLDFSKMDFSEFINELLVKFAGKYKAPNQKEIAARIQSAMGSIRKYDNNPNNQANNLTGWSGAVKDDSWEADEERRLEAERLEKLRLAKLEQERLEQERQKQLAIQQEQERQRQVAIQQEQERQRQVAEAKRREEEKFETIQELRFKWEQESAEFSIVHERRQQLHSCYSIPGRYKNHSRQAWDQAFKNADIDYKLAAQKDEAARLQYYRMLWGLTSTEKQKLESDYYSWKLKKKNTNTNTRKFWGW